MPSFGAPCGTALEPEAQVCGECGAQVGGKVPTGSCHPKKALPWKIPPQLLSVSQPGRL